MAQATVRNRDKQKLATAMQQAANDAAKQPAAVSVRTSTAQAMTSEPITKTSELMGAQSAHLASASEVANAVLSVYRDTSLEPQENRLAVVRIAKLYDVFQHADSDSIDDALSAKKQGYKSQTWEYVCQQQTKAVYRVFRDGTPAEREMLSREEVTVNIKGQVKTLKGWQAHYRAAVAIGKAIAERKQLADIKRAALAEIPDDKLDDSEVIAKAIESKVQAAKQQAAQAEIDRDTPSAVALRFAKRELYGKEGHGDDWLLDFIDVLPKMRDKAIADMTAKLLKLRKQLDDGELSQADYDKKVAKLGATLDDDDDTE